MRSGIRQVCHSTIRVAGLTPAVILARMKSTTPALHDRDFHRVHPDRLHRRPRHEQPSSSGWRHPRPESVPFARLFRRWAGISPKQYLQRLSLDAAKVSLERDSSVLEAALDAGCPAPASARPLHHRRGGDSGEFKARGEDWCSGTARPPPRRYRRRRCHRRGIAFLGFRNEDGSIPGWDEFGRRGPRPTGGGTISRPEGSRDDLGLSPNRDRRLTLWVHGSNFQMQVWQALLRCAAHST